MAIWTCENCGTKFKRDRSGTRPVRFCGQPCYHTWRRESGITAGQFAPGNKPWNDGQKGLHLSPSSEFKKGQPAINKYPVGKVTIRRNSRDRTPRSWVKVANPNIWREKAKVVWEKKHGAIAPGMVIHHIDGNSLNDSIDNLRAVTRAEHIQLHRHDLQAGKQAVESNPGAQDAEGTE